MTERRSSSKGRGVEILLGGAQALGTAPRDAGAREPSTPAAEPAPEPESAESAAPDTEPGAGTDLLPAPAADADTAPAATEVPAPDAEDVGGSESPAAGADVAAEAGAPGPPAPEGDEQAEPPAGEVATELPAPQVEAPPADDLEDALYEEALAAESAPGEEEKWVAEMEWPPTPEMELAFFEEARLAEDSPQAQASAPPGAPDSEGEVEGRLGLIGAVLPPTPGGEVPDEEESEAMYATDIQSPEEVVEPYELPERPLPEDQKKTIAEASDSRFQELDQAISQAYDEVIAQVGENESIANDCFNQLLKARDIVLRRDVARLAQAEYYIEQARARLKRAATSKSGSRRHAWWITIWGFLWAVAYIGALVILDSAWATEAIDLLQLKSTYVDPTIFLPAMVWGGLGGVVAIWYSLFKHVSARDFDSYYNISYIGKPFFGLILGATVYMVVQLVIVSLGIWPTSLSAGVEGAITPSIAPWIIYLLAWASGFKENRIFGLVDAMMKRIFSSQGSAGSATA